MDVLDDISNRFYKMNSSTKIRFIFTFPVALVFATWLYIFYKLGNFCDKLADYTGVRYRKWLYEKQEKEDGDGEI